MNRNDPWPSANPALRYMLFSLGLNVVPEPKHVLIRKPS